MFRPSPVPFFFFFLNPRYCGYCGATHSPELLSETLQQAVGLPVSRTCQVFQIKHLRIPKHFQCDKKPSQQCQYFNNGLIHIGKKNIQQRDSTCHLHSTIPTAFIAGRKARKLLVLTPISACKELTQYSNAKRIILKTADGKLFVSLSL